MANNGTDLLDETAPPTIEQYKELTKGSSCVICGEPVMPDLFRVSEHDGGWDVAGYEEKQWLQYECGQCGDGTNLVTLNISRPRPGRTSYKLQRSVR